MPPEALDGRRVLLILIPRDDPQTAHFVAGPARWTGSALHVRYHGLYPAAVACGSPKVLAGFDPALLPRLIIPELSGRVAAAAEGVEAAVAVFCEEGPAEALTLESPFFGLAAGATDEVLLMQGEPDGDWPEDDAEARLWEGCPPWPDSEAT